MSIVHNRCASDFGSVAPFVQGLVLSSTTLTCQSVLQLMALKAASLEDGLVDEASKALERVAAQEGVPTVADLKTRYKQYRSRYPVLKDEC